MWDSCAYYMVLLQFNHNWPSEFMFYNMLEKSWIKCLRFNFGWYSFGRYALALRPLSYYHTPWSNLLLNDSIKFPAIGLNLPHKYIKPTQHHHAVKKTPILFHAVCFMIHSFTNVHEGEPDGSEMIYWYAIYYNTCCHLLY